MDSTMTVSANLARLNAAGKGILAVDEPLESTNSRLTEIGIAATEENRRFFREMLFTADGIEEHISGVIINEETLGHKTNSGRPLIYILREKGIAPGIKIDQGYVSFAPDSVEQTTKGMERLAERLKIYRQQGAVFAKWHATFKITDNTPSAALIETNATDLATFAKYCQDVDFIPIVESDVLMAGAHNLNRCQEVTGQVLHAIYAALRRKGIDCSRSVLKTNMVTSGLNADPAAPSEVAAATIAAFKKHVPADVPMIAFLSGGQKEDRANANLAAINASAADDVNATWHFTFSFGRSLQKAAMTAWAGKPENARAGQKAFIASVANASSATGRKLFK